MNIKKTTSVEAEFLERLFDTLFPICRSITGPGVRATLEEIATFVPLEIHSVPSGSAIYDWRVPPEWSIESGRLFGPEGNIVVDFADSNLHVLNYSEKVDQDLTLDELQSRLHSLPDKPDAIPYVTSYYKKTWGFCLSQSLRDKLKPGKYRARIESELNENGQLNFATSRLKSTTDSDKIFLLSSYICHPSMANNELSGPLVWTAVFDKIKKWPTRRVNYEFLLNPETIGSITYMHEIGRHLMNKIEGGLVLTCLGGPNDKLSFKASRQGDTHIDKLMKYLSDLDGSIELRPFSPIHGSDERQFCSPGFNLPMGQLSRTVYGQYEGYHNSLDDKKFMDISKIQNSVERLEKILWLYENTGYFLNLCPHGEPQLGKRDLYPSTNSSHTWSTSSDENNDSREYLNSILCVLSYSDGYYSLLDISVKCGISLDILVNAALVLEEKGLLKSLGSKGAAQAR